MRRVIGVLCIAIVMQGCGLFKSTSRVKEKVRTEETNKSEVDSVGSRIDKSVVVVTEKADTTISTQGSTSKQQTPANMDSLINGMTAMQNDLLDVQIILDPVSGLLSTVARIKPQKVPVRLDRVTTTHKDVVESTRKTGQTATTSKVSTNNTDVKKEPKKMGIWLVGLALVLIALLVAWKWKSIFK